MKLSFSDAMSFSIILLLNNPDVSIRLQFTPTVFNREMKRDTE